MSSQESPTLEAKTPLTGLVIGESPRWHEDRLWFANWGTETIVAVDLEGNREVVGKGPPGLGWSIDWLPDGRLLVTGEGLIRMEPDGSIVPHADLSGLGVNDFNEIVVDGRGNIYVNGGCTFEPGEGNAPGIIALVTPEGSVHRVANGIAFPNGMAVTPDNSTLIIAESFARRLTAFDMPCFACMLGGEDRSTLFMLAVDWRMSDSPADNIARLTGGPRTGRLLTAAAP